MLLTRLSKNCVNCEKYIFEFEKPLQNVRTLRFAYLTDNQVVMTTTTTSCVVVEILRFKISREVWKFSKSRKIVAFIEGHYKYKKVQSEDATVYEGSKFDIPYSEKLREIAIHFFFIDGLLTIDVGSCIYDLAHDKLFVDDGNVTSVTLNIFANGSTIPIGKVSFNTFVQDMYGDDTNFSRSTDKNRSTHTKKEHDHDVSDHQLIVPGFRFKRLSRVLHWDRLRSINLDRYELPIMHINSFI